MDKSGKRGLAPSQSEAKMFISFHKFPDKPYAEAEEKIPNKSPSKLSNKIF